VSIEDIQLRPGNWLRSRGGTSSRIDPKRPGESKKKSRRPFFRDATDESRQEIAAGLIRIGLLVGLVILIPSLIFAFGQGDIPLALVCCLAYASLIALKLLSPSSPRLLYVSIIAIVFSLGSFILSDGASITSGDAWLCSAAALATIFFGLAGGVSVCLAQALVLTAIGAFRGIAGALSGASFLAYVVSSMDAVGLSVLIAFSQAYLIRGLCRSIDARGKFASELSARHSELAREAAGRRDAELRADFLESHDPLTRLPNRESFELELARAIGIAAGRGRFLGIMAVGIDRFKRIGETHGNGAGDALLIEAAGRLSRSFRDDDIVARSGGDVFLVLLSDVKSPEDAKAIIDKSRLAFDRSFSISGSEIGLSASFGLAIYPNDGVGADALIRSAEAALHLSSADGPGSYRLYNGVLHARLLAQARIEGELRGALRSGAFMPWYQPKVDNYSRIVGAEALARWILPEGGLRQPSEFIRMAEHAGCIGELGREVLAKACAGAAAWERAGLDPIPISVNLSPYQFRSDDLVRDVRRILGATGLPASRLDLEITESGIMEDEANAIEKLAELKALGCSISIDDFGTGYSSFAALRDYPVDSVKLPQSFVEPLPVDLRASTITGAVIDLAHKLHFTVVAEGVENAAQFAWLGEANCDQYQGFLFSPPLSEDKFRLALANGLEAAVR
jgi:diguanylate cyclase (GGDEF)-like protein